jgi:ADP-ribosylglycohydrolase
MAIADSILHKKDFSHTIWEYGRKYEGRGYGGAFREWLKSEARQPYGSYGNGSAMRVSAVGAAFDDLTSVLEVAKASAAVTHSHPEGIKGAQAIAAAIFLARNGANKKDIKNFILKTFDYSLDFSIESIRPTYQFDVSCQGSVPQAIMAFLESTDYENALRLGISLGGDSDTIACMTGSIAAAFYAHIPMPMLDFVYQRLPNEFIDLMVQFHKKFG